MARPKLYMRRYGESTGIGCGSDERENMFPSVRPAVEAALRRSEQSADPGASG